MRRPLDKQEVVTERAVTVTQRDDDDEFVKQLTEIDNEYERQITKMCAELVGEVPGACDYFTDNVENILSLSDETINFLLAHNFFGYIAMSCVRGKFTRSQADMIVVTLTRLGGDVAIQLLANGGYRFFGSCLFEKQDNGWMKLALQALVNLSESTQNVAEELINSELIPLLVDLVVNHRGASVEVKCLAVQVLANLLDSEEAGAYKSDIRQVSLFLIENWYLCRDKSVAELLLFTGKQTLETDEVYWNPEFTGRLMNFVADSRVPDPEVVHIVLEFLRVRSEYTPEAVVFWDCGIVPWIEQFPAPDIVQFIDKFAFYSVLASKSIEMAGFVCSSELPGQLDAVLNTGNFDEKEAAADLISKTIRRVPNLSVNENVRTLVIEIIDILESASPNVVYSSLEMIDAVINWESSVGAWDFIDHLLSEDFGETLEQLIEKHEDIDQTKIAESSTIIMEKLSSRRSFLETA